MARVRVRFAKVGKIRWTSHRDTARMWERAFRRLALPLAYSNGFSPRPRVSFGLALPTGHESVAEYLDLELAGDAELDLAGLAERFSAVLPVGVDALAVAPVAPRAPSLQEEVTSCTWRLAVIGADGTMTVDASDIASRVERILGADEVVVTRQRKGVEVTDDIRPAIQSLHVLGDEADGVWIGCDLFVRPRSLRPSELVAALGPDLAEHRVRRLHQWIERDGARQEPLGVPAAATDAPHALERAS